MSGTRRGISPFIIIPVEALKLIEIVVKHLNAYFCVVVELTHNEVVVSPLRAPIHLHGVRRHAPPLRPTELDALWSFHLGLSAA